MTDDPAAQTRPLQPADVAGLVPGSVVASWRVARDIARGGFGAVYEVRHLDSDAVGALKVLHPHLVSEPSVAARLVREARIIADLRHPNIVQLLEAGLTAEGVPYLVMELLHGAELDRVVQERGRLAPPDALRVLDALCSALAAAHVRGIIHRDVKAGNVHLCGAGDTERVVLLDFGIAKLLDGADAELTASRQTLGTPASMAPEQIRGGTIDARTDIYAVGALAYHLLTGRPVFADASVTMSQYLHLHAARPRPTEVAPLPPAVDDVIVRAMAIEPNRRHADVLAFFAELRAALTTTVVAEPVARTISGAAILVQADHDAVEIDDALLDDLDAIVPLVEPVAVAAGFLYFRDLGDAWLFVGEGDASVLATAQRQIATAVETRPTRDPRVTITVTGRLGHAEVRGQVLLGGELTDPATW